MSGATHTLPDQSDSRAAEYVRAEMLSTIEAGDSVRLDASRVERISTSMLQVLLSSKASFERAGLAFEITAPSHVFCQAVREAALGQYLETLQCEEA